MKKLSHGSATGRFGRAGPPTLRGTGGNDFHASSPRAPEAGVGTHPARAHNQRLRLKTPQSTTQTATMRANDRG